MKKIFFLFVFLVALVFGWSYFFLPSSQTIIISKTMRAPAERIFSFLANQNEWNKWWPVPTKSQAPAQVYNENRYSVGASAVNTVETIIQKKDSQLTSRILVVSLTNDSSTLEWTVQENTGNNPLIKMQHYFTGQNLKADMTSILVSLKNFVEKQENIYGMKIEKAKVTDTVLVATRAKFSHYPSTPEIYGMIAKLKGYIKSQNASETNPPMLNVLQIDSNQYSVMVGIPTNRLLNGKGDIELKRFVLGNIIWGEIRGGSYTMEAAIKQLENYKIDYGLTSPAIPFASLVTDRMKESDTTKWITRVYYPVF